MNSLASLLIAFKMSLLEFVDLSLDDKLALFGLLVGSERMLLRSAFQFLIIRPPFMQCRRRFFITRIVLVRRSCRYLRPARSSRLALSLIELSTAVATVLDFSSICKCQVADILADTICILRLHEL